MSKKLTRLIEILKDMENAILAFSGGVDSTFLLKALKLSGIRVLAVTAYSETMPEHDFIDAKKMAEEIGIAHKIIETSELEIEDFIKNPQDRCFYCKDELFRKLKEIASANGYGFVLDGSNLDDMNDWRPGRKAAVKHGVRSPLVEAGFTKDDIREVSRELGLSTWDRPSSPCLSSRIPYGQRITKDDLRRVAMAEGFLRAIGFHEIRVRDHGETARIEVSEEEIPKILDSSIRKAVIEKLKSVGYKFISLDLEGYRSGSMNRVL